MPARIIGVFTCLTLIGCTNATDIDHERRPGQLRFFEFQENLTVPDTVDRASPFVVKVATYGGGCTSKGDTPVSTAAGVITVAPYDIFVTGKGFSCPDIIQSFEHTASVSLAAPGVVTIRVRGRDYPADSTLVIERRVVVR